jgi:O-acetyl-ADP-ribose deacetylase (regulator of RNase III)
MADAEIMSKKIGATMLELVRGDITALEVDAIVNAANKFLAHGGGVALAIVRKGGPAIETESETIIAEHGPLEAGDAVITSGGKLPAKFVIHTVGPVWGEGSENDKLRRAIRNSLALADEEDLKTVAFPAISTGLYRFPVDQAAKLMLTEAADYLRGTTGLERVVFCLYDDATYCEFEKAFLAL